MNDGGGARSLFYRNGTGVAQSDIADVVYAGYAIGTFVGGVDIFQVVMAVITMWLVMNFDDDPGCEDQRGYESHIGIRDSRIPEGALQEPISWKSQVR